MRGKSRNLWSSDVYKRMAAIQMCLDRSVQFRCGDTMRIVELRDIRVIDSCFFPDAISQQF